MNRTRTFKHLRAAGASMAAIGLIIAAVPAQAGGVTAGTLIENTAIASFDDGSGARTISSNTVQVRVDELLDVTLTSLDPGPVAARPGEAVLVFELTNPGNGPEAYRLTANPAVAGNDFDTSVVAIAIDSNGNGTYEPGVDAILPAPQTTAELAPDAGLRIFVIVEVPASVSDGAQSSVELTATAVTGTGAPGTIFAGQGSGGGDAVVGTTTASALARGELVAGVVSVALTKAVALRDPFGGSEAVPGSIATFTITANVTGSGSVAGLVVTDAIPAGTRYVPGSLTLDSAGLSDADDSDAGSASDAGGVRVALGTVSGGTSHAISFAVVIEE
ncbi:DUF11 domain-containing protein [Erythrobacter cryptus]|uniref:DUF11 domain-containing protein n=1 Tax=Erythrobacter cryptus TaxID=196588 RepID=UPI0004224FC0|nr:DUF11 domain-containing protein [Erythrobacter cryptus]